MDLYHQQSVDGEFFSDGGIFAKEIGGVKELNKQIAYGDTRNMLQLVYLQHMAYGNYTKQQQTWGRLVDFAGTRHGDLNQPTDFKGF